MVGNKTVRSLNGLVNVWKDALSNKMSVMAFVNSSSCPHCVVMKPEWKSFLSSKPQGLETANVPSHIFAQAHRHPLFSNIPFPGVPLVIMLRSDGKVNDLDSFIADKIPGEGRSRVALTAFAQANINKPHSTIKRPNGNRSPARASKVQAKRAGPRARKRVSARKSKK